MDACMHLPFRNYSSIYFKSQQQQLDQDNKKLKSLSDSVLMHLAPSLPLVAYAGQYTHSIYGNMVLAVQGNKLLMHFEHHPNLTGLLEALGENRFLCTYSDPVFGTKILSFTVDNKVVKSVVVAVADFVEFTTYDFVKN